MLSDISLALSAFAATDIDDLLLLAAFFSKAALSARAVFIGQFAGIAVLVLVSVAAALLALTVPPGWSALLGLIPLGMGLRALLKLREGDDDSDEVDEGLEAAERAAQKLHSQWLAVAAVTIANGGDNLGVYIPLFARSPQLIGLYALVFAVLTALWCVLAWWLVRHPRVGGSITRYGNLALPVVLIALGLVILADARQLLQ